MPARDASNHAGDDPRAEPRRNTATVRTKDVATLIAGALSAIAITTFLYTQSLPLEGVLGFLLIGFAVFVAVYLVMISLTEDGPAIQDRFASIIIHAAAMLLVFALAVVVIFAFIRGTEALPHPNFYLQDMSMAGPLDPLSNGGILHAIVGTLIQIGIALAISIPLGLTCALFLTEIPGPLSRFVRTVVEAMTALPSIVAGLFIYATVVVFLGFDRSGFAASLAITVMMLPIIIRAADVVLRLVPGNLKEASLALGAGQWRTVWGVTLPTARSGLTTAIILGTARGIGETSPVLLTAGFTQFLNLNPFSGPMVSLPLATFNFVKSPEPTMIARGFGTAAVLMVLVLILFAVARVIGGRGPGDLTTAQRRRALARSRREAERYEQRLLAASDTVATTTWSTR
ncbi:phosphate ABC transporter permease PstA [Salinibacterium sp. ZJ450]|uniref:phosphate ABC transporter permease PstA n=1 Tax=Salinibacterium sp. ZJ450 TaxID=2708338 RepID=UPI001CD292E5|nr:phosphate ABC transporter permease PstA [Salinibacterium sp. ZJ450]